MTIDIDGVKRLMRSNRAMYEDYRETNEAKIKQHEDDLERLLEYRKLLNFYLDKSTKMLDVVEMADGNDKPFRDVHKRLYETNAYADKEVNDG